jgi:hypothetical protein
VLLEPAPHHSFLIDTVSQTFLHLRNSGVILRPDEIDEELLRAMVAAVAGGLVMP